MVLTLLFVSLLALQPPAQQQRQQRPQHIPPGMIWDPYNARLVSQLNLPPDIAHQQQLFLQHQAQFQPQQLHFPEETVEFDYGTQGYSQHLTPNQKTAPGGTGPTYQTPERKRGKPAGTNATVEYYATADANPAPPADTNPAPPALPSDNSDSESAVGVQ
jgi:hypothetical protein